MRRKERKEGTLVSFIGVSNGEFIFEAKSINNWMLRSRFIMTSFKDGVMEIAFENSAIPIIAELTSGMFSRKSNCCKVSCVILTYNNQQLFIVRDTGRKNIINMLLKTMKSAKMQHASVDSETFQQINNSPFSDNYFIFEEIWGKCLWFRGMYSRRCIIISSIKDGIVYLSSPAGGLISDFVAEVSKCFNKNSNFYGVKAIEIKVNRFEIKVDLQNFEKIMELYEKAVSIDSGLYEQEKLEYYKSPDYVRAHALALKKDYRRKSVVKKIRNYTRSDFSLAPKKEKEWEELKKINSRDGYSRCVIDYAILWAQTMEYQMEKHGRNLCDIWENSSYFAASIYGITGFMYGCAVGILSSVWKYGEELRILHNARYNYSGNSVVNPAIISA